MPNLTGLADIYRRQLEIEGKASGATELNQITQSIDNKQKYTVDGINFFATQHELHNWLEAERKAKASQHVHQRLISIKKQHSCEALDLMASIEKRLKLAEEKEEGVISHAQMHDHSYCCSKHEKRFDVQIEDQVNRQAVDYDNDFALVSRC